MKAITNILNNIKDSTKPDSRFLKELVDEIRPDGIAQWKNSEKKLYSFIQLLKIDPELRDRLQLYFYHLLSDKKLTRLYTESGILSNSGFFKETSRKITETFLPPLYEDNDITKLLIEIFNRKSDYKWIAEISNDIWSDLFEVLFSSDHKTTLTVNSRRQVESAILIVSHRIANLGIEPHVIDKIYLPNETPSPFLLQNREITFLLEKSYQNNNVDSEQLSVITELLSQCKEHIESIRINRNKFGASLTLTYTLQRLLQNINRLHYLLKSISEKEKGRWLTMALLFKELVKAENKKNSLGEYFSENVELIAYQITEHAGKTGEHYITHTRKEYKKMFFSALKGGLIVSFLTIFKSAIYYLKLPLFGQAFMYSMNYSLGFMAIHLTHSTLATKQPAMTATRIAGALDTKESKDASLDPLAELIIKVSRSQFIALIGNVIIAFPVAYAVSWIYFIYSGNHVADPEKAVKMIEEIDPWNSLSLFHAAIAGVYLFIAGLISGFYDNKNVYYKISQRIACHPVLNNLFGSKAMNSIAGYLDKNLGSLAGNFFFGIFLGSTGTLGIIFGLPIDIRHITFASGNFGIAMAGLENAVAFKTILITVIGIFGIGLVNLFVSFGLALFVAIKSRKVNFKQSKKLMLILFSKVLKTPGVFFFPPKEISIEKSVKPEEKLLVKSE